LQVYVGIRLYEKFAHVFVEKIIAIFIPHDATAMEPEMMTFVFVLQSLIMLNISSH